MQSELLILTKKVIVKNILLKKRIRLIIIIKLVCKKQFEAYKQIKNLMYFHL